MIKDAPHLLVVDDDERIRELLKQYLEDQGFRVTTAGDAASALHCMQSFRFQAMIFDIMMPGEDGLQLLKRVRAQSTVPVLMISARDQSADRIEGLELGANDYIAKPFDPKELLLRLNNLLRVQSSAESGVQHLIRFGPFTFSPQTNQLLRGTSAVHLTTAEQDVLRLLLSPAGQVKTRLELCAALSLDPDTRALDVLITRLRKKVGGTQGQASGWIQTVRNKGFVIYTDALTAV